MSTPFNPTQGLVIVTARVWGPTGDTYARLALDTGATYSMIRTAKLVSIGYEPATSPGRLQMMTASSIEYVPHLTMDKLAVLRQERFNFPVVAYTLPPSASVDGLLGLDFFRGQQLTLDFRNGQITLQ